MNVSNLSPKIIRTSGFFKIKCLLKIEIKFDAFLDKFFVSILLSLKSNLIFFSKS